MSPVVAFDTLDASHSFVMFRSIVETIIEKNLCDERINRETPLHNTTLLRNA